MPISHVSRIGGHANFSTTTSYLNSSHRWLRLAAEKLNAQNGGSLKEEGTICRQRTQNLLQDRCKMPPETLSASPPLSS